MPFTVSGRVFGPNIGAGRTVALSIDGAAAAATALTNGNANYSMTVQNPPPNSFAFIVYLQGNTEVGASVSLWSSSVGNNMIIDVFQDELTVYSGNAVFISNANIATAIGNGATGITAIVSGVDGSNNLTLESGIGLRNFGEYSPQGNITCGGWRAHAASHFFSGGYTVTLAPTAAISIQTNEQPFCRITISTAQQVTLSDDLVTQNNSGVTALITLAGGSSIVAGGFRITGNITTLGPVAVNNANINLTGNLTLGGTFSGVGSTLLLNAILQVISGGNVSVQDMTKIVGGADVLTIANGITIAVTGTLTLQGGFGQLLRLRSDSEGSQYTISAQGTTKLGFLDVEDCNAGLVTGSTKINAGSTSVDSGNNTYWLFADPNVLPIAISRGVFGNEFSDAVGGQTTGTPAVTASNVFMGNNTFSNAVSAAKLGLIPATGDTFAASVTIDVTKSSHTIQASHTTSATVTYTPSGPGTAGDILTIFTATDSSGTVTATFASTFHSSGTQVTTASKVSSVMFQSDGTRWIELCRKTAISK